MSTKYIVNNVSGQTITGQPIDPKYKVYTALLTQSGGDNDTEVTSGDLTIGVTYRINVDGTDANFTNVGAPNNNLDTSFVATGTTPNSWGTNGSLRFNSGAPVAIVLENTIGNIWFSYVEVGRYNVFSDNLFVDNKTFINVTHLPNIDYLGVRFTFRKTTDPAVIDLKSIREGGDTINDALSNTPIEIRVYN